MRRLTLVLTAVTILALTAMTAFAAVGGLVGSFGPGATDPIQKRQIHSGGVAGSGQGGLLRSGGYDILARSDMSGRGGGGKRGGMMGDMMGSMGRKKGQ